MSSPRMAVPQDDVFRRLNDSLAFDWRLAPLRRRSSRSRTRRCSPPAGSSPTQDREALHARARDRRRRGARRHVPVRRGRRGRAHGDRAARHRARRRGGRPAAHGALAQRPGRHRHGDVHPPGGARRRRRDARARADADRAGRAPHRLADARLHAPAARPAGVPRSPPARLRVDAAARRAPLHAPCSTARPRCRSAQARWRV